MGIFVNQLGYLCKGKKLAMSDKAGTYQLVNLEKGNVRTLSSSHFGYDASSRDDVYKIDFSSECEEGRYCIERVEDGEKSVSFLLSDNAYTDLQDALIKCLYFQRCGCELEERHAGKFKHPACHTDKAMFLEDYVNHTPNPKTFDLQGGWHDAGDYGRYSTAAAVALGHLLYAYELFPESFKGELNIPESGNGIPDILNECRYELDWLIKMQGPDGGVYHKLTAFKHAPFIMPQEDKDQFLIYPVSSMAVADYVAVMCLASRVYSDFDPDFSKMALDKAKKSFEWLKNHDYIGFSNYPGSNTGDYQDPTDVDERLWAVCEMLRTDTEGDTEFYREMALSYVNLDIPKTDFGWTDVAGFSLLSVLTDSKHTAGEEIEKKLYSQMIKESDRLLELSLKSGYDLCMEDEDFVWGSNMVVLNRAMLLVLSSLLSSDEKKKLYEEEAKNCMHYILGRNALDRSYVTGFGEKAFSHPHNRPTACDNIEEVMKGWVSGGPFRTPMDPDALAIIKKGEAPMKCHADHEGSYSTNEITIYWNSPAVFVCAYLNRR